MHQSHPSALEAQDRPAGEVPLGLSAHLGPPRPTSTVGRRSWWRRHRSLICTLAGLAAAAGAVALSPAAGPAAVFVDRQGYHVGGHLLKEVRPGTYVNGAVVILQHGPAGDVRAAGSLDLGGRHVVGTCVMHGVLERCSFDVAGRPLTADDTLVSSGGRTWWLRRYSDGALVRIDVPLGAGVPVPIPVGR